MSNIIVQQENIQVCNIVIHNNIQTITSITNLKNVDIEFARKWLSPNLVD